MSKNYLVPTNGRYVYNWGGGGGWPGPGPGSLVNILQFGEDQTCFLRNRRRVTVFFGNENVYSMSVS